MGKKTKFYLVAADALPEIFLKVAEAKRMLHAGEVSTPYIRRAAVWPQAAVLSRFS